MEFAHGPRLGTSNGGLLVTKTMSAALLVSVVLGFHEEIIQKPPSGNRAWVATVLLGGTVLLCVATCVAMLFCRSVEESDNLRFFLYVVMHWLGPFCHMLKRLCNEEATAYTIICGLAWVHLVALINPWGKRGPLAFWKVCVMNLTTFVAAAVVLVCVCAEEDRASQFRDVQPPFRGTMLVSAFVCTLLCGVAAVGYIYTSGRHGRPLVAPFSMVLPEQLPPTRPGPMPGPQFTEDASLTSYHSYKDALERSALGAPGVSMCQQESAEWSAVLQQATDMVEAQASEQRRRSAMRAWHLRIEALASSMMAARLNTVMCLPLGAIRSYMALQRWQMARRADLVDAWVSLRSLKEWLKLCTRGGLPDNVSLHVAEFLMVRPSFLRKVEENAELIMRRHVTLPQMIGVQSAEEADADADPKASWVDQLAVDIPKLVKSIRDVLEADFKCLPEAHS